MRFSVFSYSPSFPIKMHATDAKMQKIEPDPNFFWRTKVLEAVCKRDWHNVRSFFFNVRKFRTRCAETLSLKSSPFCGVVMQWDNKCSQMKSCWNAFCHGNMPVTVGKYKSSVLSAGEGFCHNKMCWFKQDASLLVLQDYDKCCWLFPLILQWWVHILNDLFSLEQLQRLQGGLNQPEHPSNRIAMP